MTFYEINSCPTRSTDQYRTVIDQAAKYCLKGSRYDGRTFWHLKTPGIPIFERGEQSRNRTAHPRSKDTLYCKVISKPDPITTSICKEIRKKLERNRHPIFGGFSPKWQGTELVKGKAIGIFGLNMIMIG